MNVRLLSVAVAALVLPEIASATTYYDAMVNVASGLCVDVPSFSFGNVRVQQYPCNYGNNQFWRLAPTPFAGWQTVVGKGSGKCLEIPGWTTADHALAQQYTCNGGTNQMWYRVAVGGGAFAYVNGYSGKCLDVAGGTTNAGYYLQQYTCHYGPSQQFEVGEIGLAVSE